MQTNSRTENRAAAFIRPIKCVIYLRKVSREE